MSCQHVAGFVDPDGNEVCPVCEIIMTPNDGISPRRRFVITGGPAALILGAIANSLPKDDGLKLFEHLIGHPERQEEMGIAMSETPSNHDCLTSELEWVGDDCFQCTVCGKYLVGAPPKPASEPECEHDFMVRNFRDATDGTLVCIKCGITKQCSHDAGETIDPSSGSCHCKLCGQFTNLAH